MVTKQAKFAAQNVIAARFKNACLRSFPKSHQEKPRNPILLPVLVVGSPEQLNASGLKQI